MVQDHQYRRGEADRPGTSQCRVFRPLAVGRQAIFQQDRMSRIRIGSDYLNGSPIRQDYLETAIDWLSVGDIEGYMAKQQHKPNANELWLYFQSVVSWVKATFPKYREGDEGNCLGELYNAHKGDELDSAKIEKEVTRLMADDDVTTQEGIYPSS